MLYEGTQKEERASGVSSIEMSPRSSMTRYFLMILMVRQFLSLVCIKDIGPW